MSIEVPTAPHIELADVERQWGTRVALSDINLSFAPGERVAFIGPSGSGKSTLIRLLAGALSPSSGSIHVNGHLLDSMTPRELKTYRAHCGLIEQHLGLVPQLSVHRNVLVGMLAHWSSIRVAASMLWPLERQKVQDILTSVGLADRQWDQTQTLSGGQKQRVAIARALIHQPTILFADEPTSSLDPATAERVVKLLLQESRLRQTSLMLSTHWVSVVRDEVDRIIGLRDGQVILDTPPSRLTDAMLDDLYAGSCERH